MLRYTAVVIRRLELTRPPGIILSTVIHLWASGNEAMQCRQLEEYHLSCVESPYGIESPLTVGITNHGRIKPKAA